MSNIIKKADKLFNNSERGNVSSTWDLLSEFMLPNQSGIYVGEDAKGGKKTIRLYDSTAIQATQDLSAAIHSTLTNPSTKWSKLKFKNDRLNDDPQASAWLADVNNIIHDQLNESNFDTMVSKNYQGFASLGTMVLLAEEADRDVAGEFGGFRFEAVHLSQVAFTENKNGLVDILYRKFKMTLRQLMEKFDTVPKDVIESAENDPNREFEVYHCVSPRDPMSVELNEFGQAPANKRPFSSTYVLKHGDNPVLEEGGYYEFPFMVTRWSTMPGEVYGRGPGHIALPDVRSLNKVKELNLQAAGKAVNPSWLVDNRAIINQLDLRANKVNVVNGVDNIRELTTQARFDITQFTAEDLKNSIRSIFFIDKLMLPPRQETGEMTAFEIQQRLEQMQKVLGPTLSRLNSEFLTPLVVRLFSILLRSGALPELPPILQQEGINIDIRFINPLSRAQQIEELNNIRAWLLNISEIAQADPSVLDLVNTDAIAREMANARSIPQELLRGEDEVEEIRAQRAQAAQAQQALEAGVGMADIISKTGGGLGGGQG